MLRDVSTPDPAHAPDALPVLPSWFDGEDAPHAAALETCIHCGLCLTACPTYRTLKVETDSPRGRLYLMRGLAEGRIQPSDPLVSHLDRCLDCRACETVCPAGVPYSQLLESTRGQITRRFGNDHLAESGAKDRQRHLVEQRGSAVMVVGGNAEDIFFGSHLRLHMVRSVCRHGPSS